MGNRTLKENFIIKCNKIVVGKSIKKEGIYSDNILYIAQCFLYDIFEMYENKNYGDFDSAAFKAVTQNNILKIIKKYILQRFKDDINIRNCADYICNSVKRSGLQFLIDYGESHEDTRSVCDVKKSLQTILTHENTINMTIRLHKFKASLSTVKYLDEYKIDLTHIPLSHNWWKRTDND